MRTHEQVASWVIRQKGEWRALFETFNRGIVANLNTAKYEAVPYQQYAGELNRRIKAGLPV